MNEYPPRLPLCGVETLGATCKTADVAELLCTTLARAQSLCRKGTISATKVRGKWRVDTKSLLSFREDK